jgi:hypothetical protein
MQPGEPRILRHHLRGEEVQHPIPNGQVLDTHKVQLKALVVALIQAPLGSQELVHAVGPRRRHPHPRERCRLVQMREAMVGSKEVSTDRIQGNRSFRLRARTIPSLPLHYRIHGAPP